MPFSVGIEVLFCNFKVLPCKSEGCEYAKCISILVIWLEISSFAHLKCKNPVLLKIASAKSHELDNHHFNLYGVSD